MKLQPQTAITSMVKTVIILIIITSVLYLINSIFAAKSGNVLSVKSEPEFWIMLHRRSNKEFLYFGKPGDISNSYLQKTFIVKTGISNERPTPLPKLAGRDYWLIIDKLEIRDNPEIAPYFLTLDVPGIEEAPFGPQPYLECGGKQCQWILPGAFGLHGVNGDNSRLSGENPGSSGCVRHSDTDITYLYNLLDPREGPVRYYVEDI